MKITPLGKAIMVLLGLTIIYFGVRNFGADIRKWATGGKETVPAQTVTNADDFGALRNAPADPGRNAGSTGVTPGVLAAGGKISRPLVVAINTWAGHAPGIVANGGLEAGAASLYKKQFGLDVKFVLLEDPAAKLAAFRSGDVDIAYRSLSPTDIDDLDGADGVNVISGNGTEIRYLVFNTKLQPGDDDSQKLAIRRAVARTIDRQSIADNVYNGTVQPLYSMIPQGVEYANEAFADKYGDGPDTEAAKQALEDAGVDTPVPMEIWWTPSHYGTASGDEYAEIKRQLDESGLFDVTLKSTEWNQYSTAAFTDKYPQYQLGWFPDYPDADDYTSPFYLPDSFLNIHYDNPEMNKLIGQERSSDDPQTRQEAFDRIQEIGAEDAPTIPIWQADQVAAVRDGVNGVEETFDPSFIFRFWLISKDQ